MKVLVYTAPEKVVYRDFDEPRPKEGELLVKITNVGICGSDMHAYLGHDDRRSAHLILGHEASRVIEEGTQKGERIVINQSPGNQWELSFLLGWQVQFMSRSANHIDVPTSRCIC